MSDNQNENEVQGESMERQQTEIDFENESKFGKKVKRRGKKIKQTDRDTSVLEDISANPSESRPRKKQKQKVFRGCICIIFAIACLMLLYFWASSSSKVVVPEQNGKIKKQEYMIDPVKNNTSSQANEKKEQGDKTPKKQNKEQKKKPQTITVQNNKTQGGQGQSNKTQKTQNKTSVGDKKKDKDQQRQDRKNQTSKIKQNQKGNQSGKTNIPNKDDKKDGNLEKVIPKGSTRLPRVFWLYTDNERDAEQMQSDIFVNYYDQLFKRLGYEVRYVNSWSAYDWLTNQTSKKISKVMQNTLIDEPVHNILKLALLYQNGGVLATNNNIFVSQSLRFVEGMFDPVEGDFPFKYNCQQKEAFLYMHSVDHQVFGRYFTSSLIAAVPHSDILRKAFNAIGEMIIKGQVPYDNEVKLRAWNGDLSVGYIGNSLEAAINIVFYRIKKTEGQQKVNNLCKLGVQSPKDEVILSVAGKPYKQQQKMFTRQDYKTLTEPKGKVPIQVVSDFHIGATFAYLQQLILDRVKPETVPKGSLIHRVLSAPGNREVFLEPLPEKKVELCLVVMDSLSEGELPALRDAFDGQTFRDWRLYLPLKGFKGEPQELKPRVFKMGARSNRVHNTEKAVAAYCPHRSYAVLLNKGDSFPSAKALEEIAMGVKPRNTLGLLLPVVVNGKEVKPAASYLRFDRVREGIVNPNLNALNGILNHYRVFSVQTFKQIPKDLIVDLFGKYFEDRVIFLMDLIDFTRDNMPINAHVHFIKKKFHDLWEIPFFTQISGAKIQVRAWEEVSREQLAATSSRLSGFSLAYTLPTMIAYRVPFPKIVAFNEGHDFVSVDDKKGPELIPRKIHQVWIGSQLPPAKKYMYEKAKKVYPAYEVRLWGGNDITPQNFPETYDIIKNLLRFEKCSPYKKLATVADIMRHQILYNEGGFWKDSGMQFFRPILDKFLKYKVMIHRDRVGRYRFLQGMCFYGNMPRVENMRRINNFRNLNRMRIYTSDPFNIAGPVDWRQFIYRQEEYDPQVLFVPYERFNPSPMGMHPVSDLCVTRRLAPGQQAQVYERGWYLTKDCDKKYPYAFGYEHNVFGGSWLGRRNRRC